MASCRAKTFYLAPGRKIHFSQASIFAKNPADGSLTQFFNRRGVKDFITEHPEWDKVLYLVDGRETPAGLAERFAKNPGSIQMYKTCERTIEGRRPRNQRTHVIHRWTYQGLESVGGSRQAAEALFKNAGPRALDAARRRIEGGCVWQVQVLAAAWSSGLIEDPRMLRRLLEVKTHPVKAHPDGMLDPVFTALRRKEEARAGTVKVEKLVQQIMNPLEYADAGAVHKLLVEGKIGAEVETQLARHKDPNFRATVAKFAKSGETLEILAKDENHMVRQYVAENHNTSPELLETLAGDGDLLVRRVVAGNPNASPELLERLAGDEDPGVRMRVAWHPNVRPEILERLAKDEASEVRAEVAESRNTGPELLEILAKDENHMVHQGLAKNPNTSPELLERLANSGDPLVRRFVADNPNTSPKTLAILAEEAEIETRVRVGSNPNTSPELLETLAGNKEPFVRASVANNPYTSPELLEILAGDESPFVRGILVTNPNVRPEILERLANDEEITVRCSVARDSHTSPELLETMAGDKDSFVRAEVANNRNTSPKTLEILAEDEDPEVRRLVAINPNTRPDLALRVITKLAEEHEVGKYDAELQVNRIGYEAEPLLLRTDIPLDDIPEEIKTMHTDSYEYRCIVEGRVPPKDASERLLRAAVLEDDAKEVGSIDDLYLALDEQILHEKHEQTAGSVSGEREDGWGVQPIKTVRELRDNANHMGNCTAGAEDAMRDGRSLVFKVTAPDGETYNAVLVGPPWRVGEINNRFNEWSKSGPDPKVEAKIRSLFPFLT